MHNDSPDSALFPCPSDECHARRHIRPAHFVTYDAMLAIAKANTKRSENEALIFWGALGLLANRNNRGEQQESEAIKSLVESGWLIELEKGRRFHGRYTTSKYQIVEHADYAR